MNTVVHLFGHLLICSLNSSINMTESLINTIITKIIRLAFRCMGIDYVIYLIQESASVKLCCVEIVIKVNYLLFIACQ